MGLRYTTSTVDAGNDSLLTYVLGYDTTTGRGGPRHIARGRPPSVGEALVDDVAADELGVSVGDTVTILGGAFTVSGLSTDGTYIANTTVFITTEDFAAIRGTTYAYILVGTRNDTSPGILEQRLA